MVQVRVVPHWSTLCLCENVYPSLLACAPPLVVCRLVNDTHKSKSGDGGMGINRNGWLRRYERQRWPSQQILGWKSRVG